MQSIGIQQIECLAESDDRLVEKIRCGDQFGLKELFARYYSGLFRFTYRLVKSKEDVEDIVESVFERIWLNRMDLNPNKSIKSFLFTAVQNQAIDFLRHEKCKHLLISRSAHVEADSEDRSEPTSYSDPVQDMVETELAIAVKEAVDRLPKRTKTIFVLNRQDGLTYSEIAEVLDISVRTVEHQIVRALRHLRGDLRHYIG